MADIISKALLSEVLGASCKMDTEADKKEVIYYIELIKGHRLPHLTYCKNDKGFFIRCNINIHELAYKCKEWAFKEGYILESGIMSTNTSRWIATCRKLNGVQVMSQPHDTEPEAIFKACQWILDNKGKQ